MISRSLNDLTKNYDFKNWLRGDSKTFRHSQMCEDQCQKITQSVKKLFSRCLIKRPKICESEVNTIREIWRQSRSRDALGGDRERKFTRWIVALT